MAKMYPAHIFSGTKSPGEVEIFQRLKDDPLTKNWIVLHSLDISHHKSQVVGEVDFVLIVPEKGIICLEVKASHSIRREDGLWYYGMNPVPDARGPFKQASEAMHSIRTRLVSQHPKYSTVMFCSAVVFPYLEFDIHSDEWHIWQVIDSKRFRSSSFAQLVLNVADNARSHLSRNPNAWWFNLETKEPTIQDCHFLCSTFRPDFEFFESPASRTERRDEELKTYTQDQFEALDAMDSNPRVIFSGPAGTGKTLLAIEAVRRSVLTQKKVLFCCFNRLLGAWLKKQLKDILPKEHVGTIHSYMLFVAGINLPEYAGKKFWEEELPRETIGKLLLDETGRYRFDEIIIDEAQDLIEDIYLDIIDLSLEGGLSSGRWRIFGDFEKQAIYASGRDNVINRLNNRLAGVPQYSLRVNCRNTPRIAELTYLLGGLNPKYTKVRRPDNQVEPEIITYRNAEKQHERLVKVIKRLLSEGFAYQDIVILSTKNDQDASAAHVAENGRVTLRPIKSKGKMDQVGYCTIHSFKGLEAPAVVITDIENYDSESITALFYVAITRALDRLVILVNEKARREMLDTIIKG